jgi:acetyltransferase-like isoleucine patch superfamily enzyme
MRALFSFADGWLRRLEAFRAQAILKRCARVGQDVRLRMPVVVYSPENLSIGSQVDIGEFVVLRANGGMRIGDRVLIAAHATLTTRGHPILPPRYGHTVDAPIVIEDDVWVGAAAVVLPGVTIGRGSIVGAGAVVTKDVPAETIVGGVPGRPIRGTSSSNATEAH